MTRIFSRGLLTDLVLDHLSTMLGVAGPLIGDAIAPLEGGWTGGQPGQGKFIAYSVLTPGTASHRERDPLGVDDTSWSASFSLRHVGGNRQQVEWAGDKTREALSLLRKVPLSLDGPWRLLQPRFETLGAVSRNDSTDPPYWESADTVVLWLEREQT